MLHALAMRRVAVSSRFANVLRSSSCLATRRHGSLSSCLATRRHDSLSSCLAARRHDSLRSICSSSSSEQLTAEVWQELAKSGAAPPLRFPVGTPVRCFVGDRGWLTGKVIMHEYREPSWPAEQPTAPYQILIDDEHIVGPTGANAIWAPADVDELIQTNFRFPLGADVECRVNENEWVRCVVVGQLYREASFPSGQYAPYQVRVSGVLPGSLVSDQLEQFVDKLIWVPQDNAQNIRPFSDSRWEALLSLIEQRDSGRLAEQEYLEKRISIIHDEEYASIARPGEATK